MSGLQRRRGGHASKEKYSVSGEEAEHKVGYDPEDVPRQKENLLPSLTLMDEVFLLGVKDDKGYLSFWNDSISYVLRGCILIELVFRGMIRMVNDPLRRRVPLPDRLIEVVDDKLTGEVLLDETIKIIRSSEPLSVQAWMDYLSGETWNISKMSYQLKQVRERLAKGLVDKGILRTEKQNFFLFDMATHPVDDTAVKAALCRRVNVFLTSNSLQLPSSPGFDEKLPLKYLRTVALVTCSFAATVLENAFSMGVRDSALYRADELLSDYSEWPFLTRKTSWTNALSDEVNKEMEAVGDTYQLHFEILAAVLRVFTQLDAVL